jgi:hypothetical protein
MFEDETNDCTPIDDESALGCLGVIFIAILVWAIWF